jgi:SNF2 family DNA or RNA helicase
VFYARRYCEGKRFFKTLKNGQRRQIWITNGASNLEELSNKTKNVILRRLKSEVLDLPDKTVTPIYQELSKNSREKYTELWDNYLIKRKEDGKSTNVDRNLTELILLRKFIAMEAIPYTIELVENALQEGEKVIIFTCFTEELLELQRYFGKKCVVHHGSMNNTNKQYSVDEFQNNNKIKVIIGNINSMGVGLTLTSGSVTVFNSFQWSPSENEQAEDRNHRLGTKNNVTIYYQLFEDTISIRIWENIRNKKLSISTILNEIDL